MITAKTKICMVIGDPIGHSLSPQMHNAGLKALGIDSELVFVACDVKIRDMSDFIKGVRAMGIAGVSATLPHKIEIMKYMDTVDETARKIGAVNTVVNDNGALKGYNTDWLGALIPLEKKTELKNKRVGLLGAGGAARAIIYGLKKKGSIITLFNRSLKNANTLAEEFACGACGLDSLEQVLDMDILINATSVGMNEDKSPIDKKFLNKDHIVFDIIYTPKETRLIKDAKEKGAQVILGYEMLLYQGAQQFRLYTGFDAPVEAMRKAILKNV